MVNKAASPRRQDLDCFKEIVELNPEEFHKLSKDLLSVISNFRPMIRARNISSPFLVDMADWEEILSLR
ncbi:MAG: hypothetical protein H0U57_14530 [Tatlockia sp.]|nr:hypothetical protein [Tatlockia sp.]